MTKPICEIPTSPYPFKGVYWIQYVFRSLVVISLLFGVPRVSHPKEIRISTRFIVNDLKKAVENCKDLEDGIRIDMEKLLTTDCVLAFDDSLLDKSASCYPWPEWLGRNSSFTLYYLLVDSLLASDEPRYKKIVMEPESKAKGFFLKLVSPYVIDYHSRSHYCLANASLVYWDNLKAFPLIDSTTYRKYYGENKLSHERKKALVEILAKHVASLEKYRSTHPKRIRIIKNLSRERDFIVQELFSHLIHELTVQKQLYMHSLVCESHSAEPRLPVVEPDAHLDSLFACRALHNKYFRLFPAPFPAPFYLEDNMMISGMLFRNALILEKPPDNGRNVTVSIAGTDRIVFSHKVPFATGISNITSADISSPFFSHFLIDNENQSVMKSGLVPPDYFLPKTTDVIVRKNKQGLLVTYSSDRETLVFPKLEGFPEERDSMRAKLISVHGFYDRENGCLYMQNRPLVLDSHMEWFPETYYRIYNEKKVVIKHLNNISPVLAGIEVKHGEITSKKYEVSEETGITNVSIPFSLDNPKYVYDVKLRTDDKNPAKIYGVMVYYLDGSMLGLFREDLFLTLASFFYPGWIKNIILWIGSVKSNRKPAWLKIVFKHYENKKSDIGKSLYSLTCEKVEQTREWKRVYIQYQPGFPFVKVHALILKEI